MSSVAKLNHVRGIKARIYEKASSKCSILKACG